MFKIIRCGFIKAHINHSIVNIHKSSLSGLTLEIGREELGLCKHSGTGKVNCTILTIFSNSL
jgi:hypothetical protein